MKLHRRDHCRVSFKYVRRVSSLDVPNPNGSIGARRRQKLPGWVHTHRQHRHLVRFPFSSDKSPRVHVEFSQRERPRRREHFLPVGAKTQRRDWFRISIRSRSHAASGRVHQRHLVPVRARQKNHAAFTTMILLVLDGDWPASVERLQSVLRRVRPTRDVLVFRHLSSDDYSLFVWATTLLALLLRPSVRPSSSSSSPPNTQRESLLSLSLSLSPWC